VGSPCRAAPPSPWAPRAVVHNLRAGTPSRGTATAGRVCQFAVHLFDAYGQTVGDDDQFMVGVAGVGCG